MFVRNLAPYLKPWWYISIPILAHISRNKAWVLLLSVACPARTLTGVLLPRALVFPYRVMANGGISIVSTKEIVTLDSK